MDIVALSSGMAQQRAQLDAAVQVQKMALTGAKDQGAALVKMMDTAKVITDPALGNSVNLLA